MVTSRDCPVCVKIVQNNHLIEVKSKEKIVYGLCGYDYDFVRNMLTCQGDYPDDSRWNFIHLHYFQPGTENVSISFFGLAGPEAISQFVFTANPEDKESSLRQIHTLTAKGVDEKNSEGRVKIPVAFSKVIENLIPDPRMIWRQVHFKPCFFFYLEENRVKYANNFKTFHNFFVRCNDLETTTSLPYTVVHNKEEAQDLDIFKHQRKYDKDDSQLTCVKKTVLIPLPRTFYNSRQR